MRFSLRHLFNAARHVFGASSDAIKWNDHDLTVVSRDLFNPLRALYLPRAEAGPFRSGRAVPLAPEGRDKLTLGGYAEWLKSGAVSSLIGLLPIQRVELRKSRRLPFRHEYILVFVNYQGRRYVIRMDRLGKLGSLVKGSRWHSGNVGVGGLSDDCIRVEEEESAEGQLLINDIGPDSSHSDTIVDLHHWSTSIGDENNYLTLWQAARETYAYISRRIEELELEIHERKALHDYNPRSPLLPFIISTNGRAYVSAASSHFSTFLLGLSAHIRPPVTRSLGAFGRRIAFQLRRFNFIYAMFIRLCHVITQAGSASDSGDNELGGSKNLVFQLLHDLNIARTERAGGREDDEVDSYKPRLMRKLLESRTLVDIIPLLRTNSLDVLRPRSVPIHMAELRQLLDSIPDRVQGRFCELSGHVGFPRDPGMIEALQFLNGLHIADGDDTEPVDPVQRLQSLYNLSRPPLTLLGLADRLEVISLAWPKYNLVTTNCELFSRSICYLERARGFCFASQGYIGGQATTCRLTKTLTAGFMTYCYAVCIFFVISAFMVMFGLVGGVIKLSLARAQIAQVSFVVGSVILALPVPVSQTALFRVRRGCLNHPLWKQYSQRVSLPNSWNEGAFSVRTLVALPRHQHPARMSDTV